MLTTARVWTVNDAAIQEHLNIQLPRGCSRRTQGDLTCFMMWINVAVKTNQRRKQDKTRSTQKKMQEPEVPAFYFIFLGVPPPLTTDEGQWPGGGCLTSFSFCTCPLYFTWVFLSYLMPSHFIGIFSLGPSILFYFFRGSTPLATDEACFGRT